MKVNSPNSLTAFKVEKALRILNKRIADIPDVQRWANEVGVSRRWLCKTMKKKYGKPPKIILREKRFTVIKESLKKNPEMSGYCVASDACLRDEKALYKFLSIHFNTSLTQLRIEILNGEHQT